MRKTKINNILYILIVIVFIINSINGYVYADNILARAALVIDSSNEKILYAKNPHMKLPPASTAKLMTAIVVLDTLYLNELVTVSKMASAVLTPAPYIKKSEKYTVRALLYLMLMRSNNGAALALAEAVAGSQKKFVYLMNKKALEIGAINTNFINPNGLPGEGQYITVSDLASIMNESLKYPLIRQILNTKYQNIRAFKGREMFLENTNKLLWQDSSIIGGKTGYTKKAGHCLVVAAKMWDHTLITAVLGGTLRDYIWEDTRLLLSTGYDVINGNKEPFIYFDNYTNKKFSAIYYSKHKKSKTEKNLISKNKFNKKHMHKASVVLKYKNKKPTKYL